MAENLGILLASGLGAGLIGGMLGLGGGIVLMPVLRFVLGMPAPAAAGTCIVAVFFTTLGGGFRHYRLGHVPRRGLMPVIAAGVLSTAVFSLLFVPLAHRGSWLDLGIGGVFLLVALRMIHDGFRVSAESGGASRPHAGTLEGPLAGKTLLGILAGVFPGLLGIGTGAVLVPGFSLLLRAPVKVAIGSSLVCFSANALVSSLIKLLQGYVSLPAAVPVSLACLVGSQVGALVNHRFPSRLLKILLGIAFAAVAYRFARAGMTGYP